MFSRFAASAVGPVRGAGRRGAGQVLGRSLGHANAAAPGRALLGHSLRRSASSSAAPAGQRVGANAAPLLLTVGCGAAAGYLALQSSSLHAREMPESDKVLFKTFYRHASVQNKANGKFYMTVDDFVACMTPALLDISPTRLKTLFEVAVGSQNVGLISLEEFLAFNRLLAQPDAEYLIAFKVMDRDNSGSISKDQFRAVINANQSDDSPPFDFHTEWVNLFFGAKGDSLLSYEEFSQLLKGLSLERVRQEFRFYENKETGLVTPDQFKKILDHIHLALPPGLRDPSHLDRMATLRRDADDGRGEGISYAQIIAFTNLILHMPSYGRVLTQAMRDTQKTHISKEDFLNAAHKATSIEITPMELQLIFTFFDLKGDGLLDVDEFTTITSQAIKDMALDASYITKRGATTPEVSRSIADHFIEGTIHFGMGAIAGGIGATVVYPIDLVKTRMQNQRVSASGGQRLYKNSIDCFRQVIRNEGAMGLYRGLGPQLVGVAPEKAIKLSMNDLLRSLFKNKDQGDVYLPLEILAGGGAGASQVIFTNPLEIVKIRLQVQGESLRRGLITAGETQGAVSIMRELGITGLYKGAGACLLRDVPFSGIYFPLYAKMKGHFASEGGVTGWAGLLLAGACAGAPAASLTTPADVIKTRIQVKARKGETEYLGIRDCFVKVYAQEGPTAFFKGAIARVVRSSPQFGVTLLAYELLQRFVSPVGEARPPTNAPVSSLDLDIAFNNFNRKVEKVESRWFGIFQDYGNEDEQNST